MIATYKKLINIQNNSKLSKEEKVEKIKELITQSKAKNKPLTEEDRKKSKEYYKEYLKNNPEKYEKYKIKAKERYEKKSKKLVFCKHCKCYCMLLTFKNHLKTKKHQLNSGEIDIEIKPEHIKETRRGKCDICDNGREYTNLKAHCVSKKHLINVINKGL